MTVLLQRGATWLGGKLQVAGGRTITYERRGQTFSAVGTPNIVGYHIDDDDGIPRNHTFHDWTFTFSDLGFDNDDTTFDVQPGDQISETLDGIESVYEAMPNVTRLGQNKIMEWMDSAGLLVVIHTKLVRRG